MRKTNCETYLTNPYVPQRLAPPSPFILRPSPFPSLPSLFNRAKLVTLVHVRAAPDRPASAFCPLPSACCRGFRRSAPPRLSAADGVRSAAASRRESELPVCPGRARGPLLRQSPPRADLPPRLVG